MNFGGWFKRVAAAGAIVSAASASAGQVIETASWSFVAPAGWTVDLNAKPVQAVGPKGELLQFSSYKLPTSSQGPEAQSIRAEVETNALSSMKRAGSEKPLRIESPLSKTSLPANVSLHQMVSKTEDGMTIFAQFAMLGLRAAVLITLEAPTSSAVLATVRNAIANMKWTP